LVEPDSAFQRYVDGGLELFGIEADETERSVMEGVFEVYRPLLEALLAADLDDVEPERPLDLSRAPVE
jgi:hypothetical protein